MSYSKVLINFFLLFFITSFSSSASLNNNIHKCSKSQSDALLLFKHNLSSINDTSFDSTCSDWLGSDYHPIMMSWNTSTDCCNWKGVTCARSTGDVIGIEVSCGMLSGTIHPNSSLFNLPHLQRLNLAYNYFTEEFPREIGRFSSSLTHLNLSNCFFVGGVPTDITLLHKLVSFDISSPGIDFTIETDVFINMLRNLTKLEELSLVFVHIPSVLPTSLKISPPLKLLNLRSTGLHGNLPHYIFNHHSLQTLDMSQNSFTGDLPTKISYNLSSLTYLDLSLNRLTGTLPSWLFTSSSLEYLSLSGNMLSGTVPFESSASPSSISFNLTQLTSMDLSSNKLNGALPSWLFTFPSLKYLNLRNNMLSGNVPFESFALPSLQMLDLGQNQLAGHIDDQTFQQLTNLIYLYLPFNNFSGELELDTLLTSLRNLEYLDLSHSGFSLTTKNLDHYVNPGFRYLKLASCRLKVFPKSFRAMKQLEELDLSGNDIHGQIPHWAGEIGGNELFSLNLSCNFITGLPKFQWYGLFELYLQSNLIHGPFPTSVCNMSNLRYLDMSSNHFGKSIPQCFGYITSFLEMIDMGNNSFQGTIPNVYGGCGSLEGLSLNGNLLGGNVPISLSNCQSLKVVDFGNNHLNGTFPAWLGDLPNLQALVLKSNNFQGHIQHSSAIEPPFPSLRVLDLSHNRFAGELPIKYLQSVNSKKNVVKSSTTPEYLSMGGKYYSFVVVVKGVNQDFPQIFVDYTIIDLSVNQFEGKIPDIIGGLNSLIVLNLSHNNLIGPIPHALGNLSEIESLDLSWNQLSGDIPQSLADIKTLEVLNLSQNDLVGRIPEGPQFRTFEGNSFGGNPKLCGNPLPKKCGKHLLEPQLESDDEESGFTWEVVMYGYGCGTLLGLGMGYLMLSTRKVKWFNAFVDAAESLVLKKKKRRHVYIGK